MTARHTVLITGATGYIGRRLTHRLIGNPDIDIRILVRNRHKVQVSIIPHVELFEGTTFDKDSLLPSLQGVDTAFYLIHSMDSSGDYQQLDRQSAENFRDACIQAGVKRIIYLGGLGTRENSSKHLLSRIETGEILSAKPGAIESIWFRAGVIIGSGSASFEIIRHLVQKLPVMITPKWVRTRTQPIGIEDVLSYLERAIELPELGNLTIDIGSTPLSFQNMILQAAEVMGLKRLLLPVPILSPKLSSYWLMFFTPVPRRLASALIAGLKCETLVLNDNACQYFPSIVPAPFRETVLLAMQELVQNQVLSRWCDSSGQEACDIKDFDNPAGAVLRDERTVIFTHGENRHGVFQAACAVGGPNGWFRYNFLWRLRGLIDKLAGGYGLNRGRRSASELRIGDALDFWKVADIKPNKRLLLFAQMKLPGKAWLEFSVDDDRLVQTAHFLPQGLLGRLYWFAIMPLHELVFEDLARTIVRASMRKDLH